jgi:hypothetical protein
MLLFFGTFGFKRQTPIANGNLLPENAKDGWCLKRTELAQALPDGGDIAPAMLCCAGHFLGTFTTLSISGCFHSAVGRSNPLGRTITGSNRAIPAKSSHRH